MGTLAERIAERQKNLQTQGLLRQRVVRSVDDQMLDFAGNDYLGLARSSELKQAVIDGVTQYNIGSGASPLVNGYHAVHQQLEQLLCQHTGHEAALLFCSGFSANHALCQALFMPDDVVVTDKLIHASVIDGIRSSGANLKRFLHNDMSSAQQLVDNFKPVAVMTESVFSMDGDCAPLNTLATIAAKQQSYLIVDDAHGFGVLGNHGIGASSTGAPIDIQVVTFGKALGCQGAAILASQTTIDFLVANARHYIYSTAISPLNAYVATCALTMSVSRDDLRQQLQSNINYFQKRCGDLGIHVMGSCSPIQPVIVGDNARVQQVGKTLADIGFKVGVIRPPTVPAGSARLRVTLSAYHQQSQLEQLTLALRQSLTEAGVD